MNHWRVHSRCNAQRVKRREKLIVIALVLDRAVPCLMAQARRNRLIVGSPAERPIHPTVYFDETLKLRLTARTIERGSLIQRQRTICTSSLKSTSP